MREEMFNNIYRDINWENNQRFILSLHRQKTHSPLGGWMNDNNYQP